MKILVFVSMLLVALTVPLSAAQRSNLPDTKDVQKPEDSAVRTADGEISKLDTTAKTITLKGIAPARENVFYYDDKTEVTGVDKGIQGLKTGSMVKISYRDEKGKNKATKIEVQSRKS